MWDMGGRKKGCRAPSGATGDGEQDTVESCPFSGPLSTGEGVKIVLLQEEM